MEESAEQLRDSLIIIKPVSEKFHNEIIQQILLPEKKEYEPLVDKKMQSDHMRLAPLLSMQLSSVIGFESNNRKSLAYCHSYQTTCEEFGFIPTIPKS